MIKLYTVAIENRQDPTDFFTDFMATECDVTYYITDLPRCYTVKITDNTTGRTVGRGKFTV